MPKSSDPNSELALVKDVFEIKSQHNTGHEPGVVAVLDRLVADGVDTLIGKVALVRTPAGRTFRVHIDDARDHGKVHSLFFKTLVAADVPTGSSIEVHDGTA